MAKRANAKRVRDDHADLDERAILLLSNAKSRIRVP